MWASIAPDGVSGSDLVVDPCDRGVDPVHRPVTQSTDLVARRIDVVGRTPQVGAHGEAQPLTLGPQSASQPIVNLDRDVGQHPKFHVPTVAGTSLDRQGVQIRQQLDLIV